VGADSRIVVAYTSGPDVLLLENVPNDPQPRRLTSVGQRRALFVGLDVASNGRIAAAFMNLETVTSRVMIFVDGLMSKPEFISANGITWGGRHIAARHLDDNRFLVVHQYSGARNRMLESIEVDVSSGTPTATASPLPTETYSEPGLHPQIYSPSPDTVWVAYGGANGFSGTEATGTVLVTVDGDGRSVQPYSNGPVAPELMGLTMLPVGSPRTPLLVFSAIPDGQSETRLFAATGSNQTQLVAPDGLPADVGAPAMGAVEGQLGIVAFQRNGTPHFFATRAFAQGFSGVLRFEKPPFAFNRAKVFAMAETDHVVYDIVVHSSNTQASDLVDIVDMVEATLVHRRIRCTK
jgi:hypothetical protein